MFGTQSLTGQSFDTICGACSPRVFTMVTRVPESASERLTVNVDNTKRCVACFM